VNRSSLPEPWHDLQRQVASADHVVSRDVYYKIRQLFLSSLDDLPDLKQIGPEYGKLEFLLCVDDNGELVPFLPEVLEDFGQTAHRYPEFARWFQAVASEENGLTVLLVARWLCHLIGVRHRTVHLFIDHPQTDNYTLIQVRGLGKVESPGCFDLPAAGHIAGLALTTDTLLKELEEELGLDPNDIVNLEQIGCYEYQGVEDGPAAHNIELRTVFRSRLKADRLDGIRFVDGEVAAVCLFTMRELKVLLGTFPEMVASGLRASFPIYLGSRGNSLREQ
jgi:isopentenyldiphosphate isomerase